MKKEKSEYVTRSQKRTMDYFINHYDDKCGYPTYATASRDLNVSTSTVYFHIENLIRLGYCKKDARGCLHFIGRTDLPLIRTNEDIKNMINDVIDDLMLEGADMFYYNRYEIKTKLEDIIKELQ